MPCTSAFVLVSSPAAASGFHAFMHCFFHFDRTLTFCGLRIVSRVWACGHVCVRARVCVCVRVLVRVCVFVHANPLGLVLDAPA